MSTQTDWLLSDPIEEMTAPRAEVQIKRQRTSAWLIGAFSVVFLLLATLNAAWKPLWSDELFTFHIANLPALDDTMGALRDGTDTLPPFFYLVTRASMQVFGATEFAVRLPAVLGFWLMCVCLFFIARRWCTPFGSAVAMLFPCVTGAYLYAFEARPYGMVLGFSSLAFLCWQKAEERPRWTSIAGLAASLAMAITSHYYAALLWGAIAVGELARSWRRKTLDWVIWIALAAGALPFLYCLPFIRASKEYVATFWAKPSLFLIYLTYNTLLTPALWVVCGLLVLIACFRSTELRTYGRAAFDQLSVAITFAAFPIVGVLLGILVTGIYTPRYTLAAVIGFAVLMSYMIDHSIRRKYLPLAAAVMFVAFLMHALLIMGTRGKELGGWTFKPGPAVERKDILAAIPEGNTPVVIASPHMFLELVRYAPAGVVSRLHYLIDRQEAVRFTKTDSADLNLSRLTRWLPIRAVHYTDFVAGHPNFLLWDDSEAPPAWVTHKLASDKAELMLQSRVKHLSLFQVKTR